MTLVHEAEHRSAPAAAWAGAKAIRVPLIAAGLLIAGLWTDQAEEALRYALLNEPQQLGFIALVTLVACWTIGRLANVLLFADQPEVAQADNGRALFAGVATDLLCFSPAMIVALLFVRVALDATADSNIELARDAVLWALGFFLGGALFVPVARAAAGSESESSEPVLAVRIGAALWLIFPFVVLSMGAFKAINAFGEWVTLRAPDWGIQLQSDTGERVAGQVSLYALLVLALLLAESLNRLIPSRSLDASPHALWRFIAWALHRFPLLPVGLLSAILALGLERLGVIEGQSPWIFAAIVLSLSLLPFGFVLRPWEAGTPGMAALARITAIFPLLPLAIVTVSWIIAVIYVAGIFGTPPPTADILFPPLATAAVIVGFLPLGLLGLDPFKLHNTDSAPGRHTLRASAAIVDSFNRIATLRQGDQRAVVAIGFLAMMLSYVFTGMFGVLFPPADNDVFVGDVSQQIFAGVENFLLPNLGPVGTMTLWAAVACGVFFPFALIGEGTRLPILSALLLWAMAISYLAWNDNHRVVGTKEEQSCEQEQKAWFDYGLEPPCSPRTPNYIWNKGITFDFSVWLKSRPDLERFTAAGKPYPIFIVATEGGGLRASYFTASVLGELQDRCPNFAAHILAISGVSGGSLGAAGFSVAAANNPAIPADTPCGAPESGKLVGVPSFRKLAHDMFRRDFLTPPLAGFLFGDALQRLLPFEVTADDARKPSSDAVGAAKETFQTPVWDRALPLERALEQAWQDAIKRCKVNCSRLVATRMSEPILDLTIRSKNGPLNPPALLLSVTEVETGRLRAIGSHMWNLRAGRGGMADTHLGFDNLQGQLHDPGNQHDPDPGHLTINDAVDNMSNLKLSTAAVLSARFPYLMPAGKIQNSTGWDRRYVDGGYFENSGAWLAAQLTRHVVDEIVKSAGTLPAVSVHVIVVNSSPQSSTENCLHKVRRYYTEPVKDSVLGEYTLHETEKNTDPSKRREAQKARACAEELANLKSLNEMLSPVRALLNVREARGAVTRNEVVDLVSVLKRVPRDEVPPSPVPRSQSSTSPDAKGAFTQLAAQTAVATLPLCVHVLAMNDETENALTEDEVPLTWILSQRASDKLDRRIDDLMKPWAQGPFDCTQRAISDTGSNPVREILGVLSRK